MAAANKQQMSTDAKGQRRTSTDTMIFNTNDVMSTDVKGEQVPPSKKKKRRRKNRYGPRSSMTPTKVVTLPLYKCLPPCVRHFARICTREAIQWQWHDDR
jgi:hypothetical protein